MTDNNETTKLLSEKRDAYGKLISEVREKFAQGQLFCTVWTSYCGPNRWTRIVYAKPMENFYCGLMGHMTVKAFSEKRNDETGRVYMRSYESPDGTTLSRDYITGQCTTRRKDGSEVVHDTAMLQKMMELAGSVHSF